MSSRISRSPSVRIFRKPRSAARRRRGWPSAPPARKMRRRNYRTAGFLGIESKFLDCAWNGVALAQSTDATGGELQPSSGCTNCLSAPAQGDGESQRDGRRYQITSCFINGVIVTTALANQADPLELPIYYVALVLDTQANAATVASEDVFVNPSTLAEGMLPSPLRNLQNSKRFRILDWKTIRPGGAYAFTDGASTGSISNMTQPSFKLGWRGNLTVDSVGTTADVASVSNNALHLVGFTSGTAMVPLIAAKSRIRFVG